MYSFHTPVLVKEAVASLRCRQGGIYVDGTIGGAGHAHAVLEETAPDGMLIGIDKDGNALFEAEKRLGVFGSRVILVKGNFADIGNILANLSIDKVEGVLLDLGVSSHQLDMPERGFSFSQDAPLDMRMDQSCGTGAFTLVNTYHEEALAEIIWEFGEERMARVIARAIIAKRRLAPIETTTELAALVTSVMPSRMKRLKIHPATRTFQAIRIAVNHELDDLKRGIGGSIDMIKPGGRLSIISFHSLEDRIVKGAFALSAKHCTCPSDLPICVCAKQAQLKLITRKPITPGQAEMLANPRSRSAKLRTAERI
jgi:16S rRNA (cytosine1402-N4)-methyltransferase